MGIEMKDNSGRWFCVFFLCLGMVVGGHAQDFKEDFTKAKQLFSSGQYSKAMDAFMPLTIYDRKNPYPEYASFYYAVSAFKLGFFSIARDQFFQIKKLYPRWEQIPEVNYWLAHLFFEQREYFQAMVATQEISKAYAADVQNMKKHYLAKVNDTETLRMLLEENPYDREVADAFLKHLTKNPVHREAHTVDSVIQRFGFLPEDYPTQAAFLSNKKERYQVGVIMPFLATTLDPSPNKKKNQNILDLYTGMRMAVDSLNKNGIRIDLLAYDNEKSAEATRKLLGRDEMKGMDLLVGPLFPEEGKLVSAFAREQEIALVINPISGNPDFVKDNPSALLFQPSYPTIARRAAEFASANAKNKYCLIYYGSNSRDSLMAKHFAKKADTLGLKVVFAQGLTLENSGTILSVLTAATEYDEWRNPKVFKLKRDSIGTIFAATDDPLYYTKIINAVEARGDSILVIGDESWLEGTSMDFRKFEKVWTALAAPNFTIFSNPALATFRKKYWSAHGVLPANYAKIGYEFMWIMGQALYQYGDHFKPFILGQKIEGSVMNGFQLQATSDNGHVPFLVFRNGEPVLATQSSSDFK
jgi:Periplasmic binding protein